MARDVAAGLLETVLNLSRFHREHEKFYGQAPLQSAIALQRAARTLKTLAGHWSEVEPASDPVRMNEPVAIQHDGVLFMEGEAEPAGLGRLKRDLAALADDFASIGEWLAQAMESSWKSAEALLPQPVLADVLGERHRIIVHDWQAAGLSTLVSRLVRRALELLEHVDFAPEAVRADLAGARGSRSGPPSSAKPTGAVSRGPHLPA